VAPFIQVDKYENSHILLINIRMCLFDAINISFNQQV
jgi:hypothetical protein